MTIKDETYNKIVKKLQHKLQPLDIEHIMVVDIDNTGYPEHFITLSKGTINSCELSMRKFEDHLCTYYPKGVVIAHNHPGNMPFPSENDNDLTASIAKVCRRNRVKLMDHIIVLKDYDEVFAYKDNDHYAKLGGVWQSKRKK